MNIKGSKGLITGAGRRLGYSFAKNLIEQGAHLALHYNTSSQGARELESFAHSKNTPAISLKADLSEPSAAQFLIDSSAQRLGKLDFLINCASIFEQKDPHHTDIECWQRHLAINLTAPVLLSERFFAQAGGADGTIINILDWRYMRPEPKHFAYSTSKSALASVTQMLARSYAPSIRVNGLALGAVLPPENEPYSDEVVLRFVPQKRWATLDEICQALLFLLTGPAYITGEILVIDGGRQLY